MYAHAWSMATNHFGSDPRVYTSRPLNWQGSKALSSRTFGGPTADGPPKNSSPIPRHLRDTKNLNQHHPSHGPPNRPIQPYGPMAEWSRSRKTSNRRCPNAMPRVQHKPTNLARPFAKMGFVQGPPPNKQSRKLIEPAHLEGYPVPAKIKQLVQRDHALALKLNWHDTTLQSAIIHGRRAIGRHGADIRT